MASYQAVWTPAANSAGGGAQDIHKVSALAITTASSAITLGFRSKFTVTVVPTPGATAVATNGANIRFTNSQTSATATASAADFMLPVNSGPPGWQFDLGDQWDTISFFNPNSTTGMTIDIYVMKFTA